MRLKSLILHVTVLSFVAIPLAAKPVTFFGEDVNNGGDPSTAPLTNANTAHDNFFLNLTGVGTESFESFTTGTLLPLNISFGAAGTAVLSDPSGTSAIESGNDTAGRYPISGTQFLVTGAGSGFTLTFTSAISAFGFYGTDVGDFGGSLSLALTGSDGNTSLAVPNTVGNNGDTTGSNLYFGFYDTANTYTSITFNNVGSGGVDVFGFDDFSIGSLQQVTPTTPEPGTYVLLGAGLVAMFVFRRKMLRA
jgi:hypothetical protein